MRLRRTFFALIAATVGFAMPAIAGSSVEFCADPNDLAQLRGSLPRTEARIALHEPLTIVAMGSSSTEGIGASGPDKTYPAQLAAALRQHLPSMSVTVFNKGIGGEISTAMLARFDRDVFAAKPDLVIWQLGTNSVLHDLPIAAHDEVVRRGLERLRGAGIDVVLMDLQYAPAVLAHPLHREMERSLATLAKENRVPLFHRFALMQHWAKADHAGFAALLSPDGLHQNDASYACVGRLLGDALIEATASRSPARIAAAPVSAKTASPP